MQRRLLTAAVVVIAGFGMGTVIDSAGLNAAGRYVRRARVGGFPPGRSGSWRRAHYAVEDCTALASLDIKGHRMTEPSTSWQLDDITYSGGTQDGPRANVKLSRAEQEVHAEGSGTGPIDAVCQSISRATGVEARVVAFRAYSVGPGSEAVGEVELDVELPGRRVAVRASSTDVVEAAGHALVAALNQYNAKRRAQG
jgi:hypothetical protein